MTDVRSEYDIFAKWLQGVIDNEPTSLYPTPLGQMDVDEYYSALLSTAVSASFEVTDDPVEIAKSPAGEDTVFNEETYSNFLEQLLYCMYRDYNLFVQYIALLTILKNSTMFVNDIVSLGLPPDFVKTLSAAGENGVKLLAKAYTSTGNHPPTTFYPSDYNMTALIELFHMQTPYIKEQMAPDMERIIEHMYSVE